MKRPRPSEVSRQRVADLLTYCAERRVIDLLGEAYERGLRDTITVVKEETAKSSGADSEATLTATPPPAAPQVDVLREAVNLAILRLRAGRWAWTASVADQLAAALAHQPVPVSADREVVAPFSTYPEDREKLLRLAKLAELSDDANAIELGDLVRSILEDEKVSIDLLAAIQASPPGWLDRDESRLALWQAIQAVKIGNPTDDKLILENLRSAGVGLARFDATLTAPLSREDVLEEAASVVQRAYDNGLIGEDIDLDDVVSAIRALSPKGVGRGE
jgi:hypothetical protein